MGDISLTVLFGLLLVLLVLSAFFSSAEIGMMSLNRYRLRHLVRRQHRMAMLVDRLLQRPDRVLSIILVGNTIANTLSPVIVTIIAVRLIGQAGLAVGPLLLTLVILIFAEIAPKTVAALYPQRVAFFAAYPLRLLLRVFSPVVWLTNTVANGFLRLFGVRIGLQKTEQISHEELRAVMHEAGRIIPHEHKEMLLSILDLEQVTVNDIMVPRNDMLGINLKEPWDDILESLENSQHTRLPIYNDTLDNIQGFVHIRDVMRLLANDKLSLESLQTAAQSCLFVPEGTALHLQLLNFKTSKTRSALVVDEYGDIQGLITLEDILEEIVGEFTTDRSFESKEVYPQQDRTFLVDGSAAIRDLNRSMGWSLPTTGPKTLSGLIIEYLEFIPPAATCLKMGNYVIEIIQVKDNMVKTARVELVNKEK